MSKFLVPRRGFLKTFPAPLLALPRPARVQEPGLREFSLIAVQRWLPVGPSLGRMYAYNGQLPGPILEARAGDTLRLAFTNQLSEPTNLHFHGLHVSPAANADNVFLEIPPGEEFFYELAIPANHPAGLFWYHPHLHGAVARQLFHGLAGAFLIRGEADEIPEIAAAAEHLLVLQDFGLNRLGEPAEPSMMEQFTGRQGPILTVSGRRNPILTVQHGGLARLRILNASPSRFYRLRLDAHPLHLIGTDAGPIPAPTPLDELLLTPGERADILVQANRAPGDFALWNLPYNRGSMGMGGAANTPALLATLRYQDSSPSPVPLPTCIASIDPLPAPSALPRTFLLSESPLPGRGMRFLINGKEFDHHRTDTQVRLDTVEDWDIVNLGSMDHPFHVHTNPFQILDASSQPQLAWKDVVLVPARQRRRIRTRFADFTGRTVYHCHILDHEDLGMMGTLELLD